MLQQDLQLHDSPLWGYFCQISDSTTSYGSYSGAVPNEKITWGKLAADTPKYIVESDATIVAPLIFACVLAREHDATQTPHRPLRRAGVVPTPRSSTASRVVGRRFYLRERARDMRRCVRSTDSALAIDLVDVVADIASAACISGPDPLPDVLQARVRRQRARLSRVRSQDARYQACTRGRVSHQGESSSRGREEVARRRPALRASG
jgi:hypothetical protein